MYHHPWFWILFCPTPTFISNPFIKLFSINNRMGHYFSVENFISPGQVINPPLKSPTLPIYVYSISQPLPQCHNLPGPCSHDSFLICLLLLEYSGRPSLTHFFQQAPGFLFIPNPAKAQLVIGVTYSRINPFQCFSPFLFLTS